MFHWFVLPGDVHDGWLDCEAKGTSTEKVNMISSPRWLERSRDGVIVMSVTMKSEIKLSKIAT